MVVLNGKNPSKIHEVESGYFAIDGNIIMDINNKIIGERKKLANHGALLITALILNSKVSQVIINGPGILEEKYDKETFDAIEKKVRKLISSDFNTSINKIKSDIYKVISKFIHQSLNKKPLIYINLIKG